MKQNNMILSYFLVSLTFYTIDCHGLMNTPNQRGALKKGKYTPNGVLEDSVEDYYKHFPAGSKANVAGSALSSQREAAGPAGWTPYEPFNQSFIWRAGVCGDTLNGRDHLRGGKYYNGGFIAANYTKGQVINIGIAIVGHHNGFHEFHVCDVSKCAGADISQSCFLSGNCHKLIRVKNSVCDSGNSWRCGPIDRNYPERWYTPCTNNALNDYATDFFGSDATIQYQLPIHLSCRHCVLQWYWVSANSCNPPGVVEYFIGPDKPHWGYCKGQGGAVGGFTNVQSRCGGEKFAEEYFQCADIRIVSSTDGKQSIENNFEIQAPPNQSFEIDSTGLSSVPKWSPCPRVTNNPNIDSNCFGIKPKHPSAPTTSVAPSKIEHIDPTSVMPMESTTPLPASSPLQNHIEQPDPSKTLNTSSDSKSTPRRIDPSRTASPKPSVIACMLNNGEFVRDISVIKSILQ